MVFSFHLGVITNETSAVELTEIVLEFFRNRALGVCPRVVGPDERQVLRVDLPVTSARMAARASLRRRRSLVVLPHCNPNPLVQPLLWSHEAGPEVALKLGVEAQLVPECGVKLVGAETTTTNGRR